MLPVHWRLEALEKFSEIIQFIGERDPQAARRLKERLEAAVLPLSEHPYLYRSGREPGTRELVAHPNYVIVYRVTHEQVEIIAVMHSRQEYPTQGREI